MVYVEDTRQQKGKHEIKHAYWSAQGVELLRCKLPFGDYALPPAVAVDTKEDMQEIAQNIGGTHAEHVRFRNECYAAKQAGCKLYVLIENRDGIHDLEQVRFWDNPRLKYSPKAVTGARLYRAMHTMQDKYGVTFVFCTPEEAAQKITELLTDGR